MISKQRKKNQKVQSLTWITVASSQVSLSITTLQEQEANQIKLLASHTHLKEEDNQMAQTKKFPEEGGSK